MLKKLLQLNRDYREAKEKAVEKTVNVLEAKTFPLFFVLFLTLTVGAWLMALFKVEGFEQLYIIYGFYPFVVFFIISYFSLFLGSKFIFKPTAEELSDDTSMFAIFSACRRKEMRSLISLGLSLLHTFFLFLYLVNKDMKWN